MITLQNICTNHLQIQVWYLSIIISHRIWSEETQGYPWSPKIWVPNLWEGANNQDKSGQSCAKAYGWKDCQVRAIYQIGFMKFIKIVIHLIGALIAPGWVIVHQSSTNTRLPYTNWSEKGRRWRGAFFMRDIPFWWMMCLENSIGQRVSVYQCISGGNKQE